MFVCLIVLNVLLYLVFRTTKWQLLIQSHQIKEGLVTNPNLPVSTSPLLIVAPWLYYSQTPCLLLFSSAFLNPGDKPHLVNFISVQ